MNNLDKHIRHTRLWAIGIGIGLVLTIAVAIQPGILKVFLALSALAVLGLSAVMLVVIGFARVTRRCTPWLPSLGTLAAERHVPVAIVFSGMAACVVLALFVIRQANQPVVSCASAPRKPSSTPPVALVTAQDFSAQGDYDYEQGDCDKAIADYSRAIELNPNFAEAYNNRAYVYMVKKDYASALPDLDHSLQLRPNYVNALMNRGDIYNYYYAINYERAVADYDQVLKIDPSAANHTSVCGHRMLALHHGWSLNVFGDLLTGGAKAGCPSATQ